MPFEHFFFCWAVIVVAVPARKNPFPEFHLIFPDSFWCCEQDSRKAQPHALNPGGSAKSKVVPKVWPDRSQAS